MANPTKVTFSLPSTNTDGTALDMSAITSIKVEILNDKGEVGVTDSVAGPFTSSDQTYTLPTLPAGTYTVVLFTEATSSGTAVESAGSAPVSFSIAIPSIPNPPEAVSVV